ncbi:PEP-CTERM sorting domain-containing protein [Gemmatimonas sp.]|uniref:PEP-CTERM sorting domain-containing protein n=1 Tax=Gemmatimonas sp. TaxID=1962908 RepID=UPI00286C11AC|nr:PEP-CTERM sorting domain-containing protein [Gemmatimonas sp.]
MKKISMAFGAAIALAGVTAPAQAQLVLGGLNACFIAPSGTTGSTCANGTGTATWSMPGSLSTDDDRFALQRATPDAPGGTTLVPAFGVNNKSNAFNLGYFTFDNRDNTANDATATLRFELFFGNTTNVVGLTYNSLQVNYFDKGNNPETYNFSGGAWSNWFTVGAENYRFAVVGYDTPHPGSAENYCKDYDAIPALKTGAQYGEASNGKLCGQFERQTSPNIQTVPEPSTYALMGAGLLGIFGFARRRNRNA